MHKNSSGGDRPMQKSMSRHPAKFAHFRRFLEDLVVFFGFFLLADIIFVAINDRI